MYAHQKDDSFNTGVFLLESSYMDMEEKTIEELSKGAERSYEVVSKEELPDTKSIVFGKRIGDAEIIQRTESEIGYPCLVKPDNEDVSVGSSSVRNVHELRQGILRAFRHADSIIVEQIVGMTY